MNAQIEILNGNNPGNPLWSYVGELLSIEGYSFRFVDAPSDRDRLLIVPNLLLSDSQQEIIRTHARNGGSLIAMRPSPTLLDLFGVKGGKDDQWLAPYTRHVDGEWLQIHGGTGLFECAGADAMTHLFPHLEANAEARHPAVACVEEGGSRRVCFAYDLARCCVLIQQGRPDQASDGPFRNADGDWKFSQNDLYVGHLDPRLKETPQSDLHRDLLVRAIEWTTEKTKPIPRVWRFPNAEAAGAMLDGDGDSAPRKLFDLAFGTCEEFGVPYSTYLMKDQFETITPADAKALRQKGHSVGLHPWLNAFPTCSEFETYLNRAFGEFSQRYGYIPSASRNHCVIWTGWVDLPRVESEIGVRIDLNGYPVLTFQSGVLSGTLLPAKFMDGTGQLLDIYSQYTIYADDCIVEDKCRLPAVPERERPALSQQWIDRCIRYQGMFHPTFHPIRLKEYGEPCIQWFRETLAYLQSRGVRGWSADSWAEFNDARRTVTVEPNDAGWMIRSERAVKGATILLPASSKKVLVDDEPAKTRSLVFAGQKHTAIVLDLKAEGQCKLAVRE